jgi:kynurenine formamidase
MSPRATIEADGYLAHRFALGDGCGTHLDAPAHFAPGGATIERLAPVDLIAEACVVDVREACARDPDYEVTVEDVERFERVHGAIPARAVVIARTGWSARARDAEAYAGAGGDGKLHFPGFSEACARWLLDGRDVKGLAIDALSPDPGRRDGHPVHRLVLGAGRFLVENLTNLDRVPPRGAVLVVLPIRVAGAGQAPCRAIAIAP